MNNLVRVKVSKFFQAYSLRKFKNKEHLLSPEVAPVGVFYLSRGIVRQYSTSSGGEEFVINIFKSPSFFPMPWVLNNKLPTHYYQAMSQAEVRRAPKNEFLAFLLKNPEVLLDLIKRIYTGLEGLTLRLESMMTGSAYKRLVVELLINAKRFGVKNPKGTVVKLKLTQDELAAESGIVRETINRELKRLKEKDLVRVQKRRVVIPDLEKLEKELFVN